MKIKSAVFCLIALLLSGNALAMMRMPDTPDGRRALWMEKQQEIAQLQEDLVAARQALEMLPDKGEVDVDLDNVQEDIRKVQAGVDEIIRYAGKAEDWWVENREKNKPVRTPRVASRKVRLKDLKPDYGLPVARLSGEGLDTLFGAGVLETAEEREYIYKDLMRTASENDKEIEGPQLLERARESGDEWVKRIDGEASRRAEGKLSDETLLHEWTGAEASLPPGWSPSGGAQSPEPEPFFTPRKKLALGAAGIIALGVLFKKLPEWNKNRIKRILKEHGKKLSDLDPAEQDLFASASYARFVPGGSLLFEDAVLDMPEDTDLRDELWPILNHVYYGKKRVTRKQARELRKLYDDAKELMVID